jgi:hypothetical protein
VLSKTSEVAAWKRVGLSNSPDGRYLQAAAFDEARKVVVMFGGIITEPSDGHFVISQETWEWSPTTGKWMNRSLSGTKPAARSGAALVYDSNRAKFVLFGGRGYTGTDVRTRSGFNLDDTWEWDPVTGVWTDISPATHPSARSQHAMVFEKSTGKILLFGGGRSHPATFDGTGVSASLGDTWEFDPTAKTWTRLTPALAPSVRNDSTLVWDSARNKAVLFGGIQIEADTGPGVLKQDTWEWDPAARTWTERIGTERKPSARYGHAASFDVVRKKMVLIGGCDVTVGSVRSQPKSDVWEWEPATGVWTERLSEPEAGGPKARMYASLVSDEARGRVIMIAGAIASYTPTSDGRALTAADFVEPMMRYAPLPSREIWEVDVASVAFTDRTPERDVPSSRFSPAIAFNPVTGKTCVLGGSSAQNSKTIGEYWEWDGTNWSQPKGTPPVRSSAVMAFDPARNSMIVYGGISDDLGVGFDETWEYSSAGEWVKLSPRNTPGRLVGAAMVTDTVRKKILLYGGTLYPAVRGQEPVTAKNDVWEWDGSSMAWTKRIALNPENAPHPKRGPSAAYDEGRQRLFVYEGTEFGASGGSFFEWDPISGAWSSRGTGDSFGTVGFNRVVYDSLRRREVVLTSVSSTEGPDRTWELDSVGPTWSARALSFSPKCWYEAAMVFDSRRGVAILFGGAVYGYSKDNAAETWEYQVTTPDNRTDAGVPDAGATDGGDASVFAGVDVGSSDGGIRDTGAIDGADAAIIEGPRDAAVERGQPSGTGGVGQGTSTGATTGTGGKGGRDATLEAESHEAGGCDFGRSRSGGLQSLVVAAIVPWLLARKRRRADR